jgi:hypothetical protein
MPWREVCSMDQKVRFIAALLAREESMTELCERFGISRKTWVQGACALSGRGAAGISPRSRVPQVIPLADQRGPGGGGSWGAPRASELGAEEAARELAESRVAAPPGP